MHQVCKTVIFRTTLAFRRFWVKGPRHSENIFSEMCHLYRKTRRIVVYFRYSDPGTATYYANKARSYLRPSRSAGQHGTGTGVSISTPRTTLRCTSGAGRPPTPYPQPPKSYFACSGCYISYSSQLLSTPPPRSTLLVARRDSGQHNGW